MVFSQLVVRCGALHLVSSRAKVRRTAVEGSPPCLDCPLDECLLICSGSVGLLIRVLDAVWPDIPSVGLSVCAQMFEWPCPLSLPDCVFKSVEQKFAILVGPFPVEPLGKLSKRDLINDGHQGSFGSDVLLQPGSRTSKPFSNPLSDLVFCDEPLEEFSEVNDAIAREKQIKGWSRRKIIALIERMNTDWNDITYDLPYND
jgi:hypothetical protein